MRLGWRWGDLGGVVTGEGLRLEELANLWLRLCAGTSSIPEATSILDNSSDVVFVVAEMSESGSRTLPEGEVEPLP